VRNLYYKRYQTDNYLYVHESRLIRVHLESLEYLPLLGLQEDHLFLVVREVLVVR